MSEDIRYYLDTNMLKLLLLHRENDFITRVCDIMEGYVRILLTSSVCIHELISIARAGSIDIRDKHDRRTIGDIIFQFLEEKNIEVVPVTMKYLKLYANLPFYGEHSDPFDRLIIAQAISDRIPIITTDHLFPPYEQSGLEVIYNHK